jgi:thioredoxin-related protein
MNRLAAALLLWLALSPVQAAEAWERFFSRGLGDFREELTEARKGGKKGVLFVYQMEACDYCDRMKDAILSRADVQDWYRRHFSAYSIDILGSVEMVDFSGRRITEGRFAQEARVVGMPTLDFFDLRGRLVARVPGEVGDAATFLALGDWVASGAHARESFEQYRTRKGLPATPLKIREFKR